MSGELEAAGALATAGLAAGAIEGREPGGVHEGACLNCGTAVSGPYCSQCGQSTHPHRSLLHMIEEFLHGILHFDTKAWRTLPMLAFRPGTLTRDYVYGKRARYISPLALFLFTVFFMFFVFAVAGGPTIGDDESSDIEINASAESDVSEARRELEEARRELAQAQAELNEARANPPADEPEGLSERLAQGAVRIAEQQVERMERQLARQEELAAEIAPAAAATEQPAGEAPAEPDAAATEAPAEEATSPTVIAEGAGEQRWQDELRDAVLRGEVNINSGSAYIDEKIRHSLLNPDLALYKIQNSVYKFSFLLVPISLPFLALLFFWKRGVTLYDHVVFILYSLSFVSLLFLVVSTLIRVPGMWGPMVGGLLVCAIPVHWFFQLGGAYKLGWFSALWRTFALTILTQFTLTIFVLVIVIVGLAG